MQRLPLSEPLQVRYVADQFDFGTISQPCLAYTKLLQSQTVNDALRQDEMPIKSGIEPNFDRNCLGPQGSLQRKRQQRSATRFDTTDNQAAAPMWLAVG